MEFEPLNESFEVYEIEGGEKRGTRDLLDRSVHGIKGIQYSAEYFLRPLKLLRL